MNALGLGLREMSKRRRIYLIPVSMFFEILGIILRFMHILGIFRYQVRKKQLLA